MGPAFRNSRSILLALGVGVLAAGCGDSPLDNHQSVSVTILGGGSGSGRVLSRTSGVEIDCTIENGTTAATSPKCADTFSDAGGGGNFSLGAFPAPGSSFSSWSGCDLTVEAICELSFRASTSSVERTVTARFNLDPPAGGPCPNPLTLPFTEAFEVLDPFGHATSSTNGATAGAAWMNAGGSGGGGYLRMTHNLPSPSSITTFHLHPTAYNPADGAITGMEYSEDRIQINPPFGGAAIGGGLFILQNGVRYLVSLTGGAFTHLDWQRASRLDLTQADFPGANFGVGGAPIQFGFYRNNSNDPGGAAFTTTHGIDNFQVRLCR